MVSHNIVRDRQKLVMRAIIAPDFGLFANSTDPFIATDGLVPLFARFQTLKSFGVDIFAPPKQTAKESNFRFLGRLVGH
jgi:hypothetical protein